MFCEMNGLLITLREKHFQKFCSVDGTKLKNKSGYKIPIRLSIKITHINKTHLSRVGRLSSGGSLQSIRPQHVEANVGEERHEAQSAHHRVFLVRGQGSRTSAAQAVSRSLKNLGQLGHLQSAGAAATAQLADLALGGTAQQKIILLGQITANLLLNAQARALAVGKVTSANLVELGPNAVSAADAGIEKNGLGVINLRHLDLLMLNFIMRIKFMNRQKAKAVNRFDIIGANGHFLIIIASWCKETSGP